MKFFRVRWGITIVFGILLFQFSACDPQTEGTGDTGGIPIPLSYPSYPSEADPGQPIDTGFISVAGWFTIIHNGEPHYYLNEDNGGKYQLYFDAAGLESIGGALQFDRRRVILTGELTSANPRMLFVRTIHLQE